MGGLTQVKVRGLDKVRAVFVLAMAAYNIVRLPKLMAARGKNSGPEGRSAPGDMKGERNMPRRQAKTSKTRRIQPQKITPTNSLPKRRDLFNSLLSYQRS